MTAVATWIGALATFGLLIGAGFTVYYARKAFREQSREIAFLEQQAERDVQQRRRAASCRETNQINSLGTSSMTA